MPRAIVKSAVARILESTPEHRRGITTVYMPDTDSGTDDAGNARRFKTVAFMKGRADQVPENERRQLRDLGIID